MCLIHENQTLHLRVWTPPPKKEIEIDHQAVSVHRKAKGTTLEIYLNASSKPVSVVQFFFFVGQASGRGLCNIDCSKLQRPLNPKP